MKKTTKTLLLLTALVGLVGCGDKTSNSTDNNSSKGTQTTESSTSDTSKKTEAHVHSFTGSWKHDSTKHWKECDANDGEKSQEADHVYSANGHVCDVCGYDMYEGKGSFSGAIKLHKLGAYVTDYVGVTISADDESVVITNNNDGTYKVENCELEKTITLTFAKDGYLSATKIVMADNEETVTLKDVTLEYERFVRDLKTNWDADLMDYSHVNDEDPYLGFNYSEGGKTLIANTSDQYDDVYATWVAKKNGISTCTQRNQGIYLLFPNANKIAPIQLNGDNYNFERMPNFWGYDSNSDTIKYENVFTGWGGYTLNEEEQTAYNSDDGLKIGMIRRGSLMHMIVKGKVVATLDLPEELANEKCKVGYYVFDCANAETGHVEFHFDISSEFEDLEATINTSANDSTLGSVTNKDLHTVVGTKTDIEITPNENCKVSAITNNGIDVLSDYADGHLRTLAYSENNIVVTFAAQTYGVLDATFNGVEFDGLKKHVFADGTKVTLKSNSNTVETTVTGGKINVAKIETGTYTAKLTDDSEYCASGEITIADKQTYSTAIEVSEDALESHLAGWDHDIDNTKLKDGTFRHNNSCLLVSTKKTYLKGAITTVLNQGATLEQHALGARVKTGDNSYDIISARDERGTKVQFSADTLNWHIGAGGGGETQATMDGWDWGDLLSYSSDDDNSSWAVSTVMSADQLKEFAAACKTKRENGTLTMTFVRDGVNVYLFLDDTYLAKRTLDSSYANTEMEFIYGATGLSDSDYRDFTLSFTSDISSYLAKVGE